MNKSEVRSPESGVQRRNSKLEIRNLRFDSPKSTASSPSFDFQISNPRLRTPNSGLLTLIIGYGNPLRSDDGLGWHAGRLLAEALADGVGAPLVRARKRAGTRPAPTTAQSEHVEIITCHQLTPELAERLSQARRAVFIDASAQGQPGEIHRRTVRPQAQASSAFTHSCTPAGLLASAGRLYGRHPQAVVITVSAQSFAFGDTLSPVVSAALPQVIELVRREVRRKQVRRLKSEAPSPAVNALATTYHQNPR